MADAPPPMTPPTEWLTVAQAVAYLKVTRSTLYRWMDMGELPYYRPGGRGNRRLKREDLDGLMRRAEDARPPT